MQNFSVRLGGARFRALVSIVLPLSAAVLLAAPPAATSPARPGVVRTKASQAAMTPASALQTLKEGNGRFRSGKPVQRNLPAMRKAAAAGQYPFAAIVSCMDSRAGAEIVFDQSIGDIFSIRVAGNVVDPDVLGSLEYAAKVAGVKLIAVIGHSSCGGVKGAIEGVKLGNLTELLARIEPAVKAVGPGTVEDHAYVDRCVEQNVRNSLKEIREKSSVLRELINSGAVGLVGGMYDLETGEVRFSED